MDNSLPLDLYKYLFALSRFRLHDILNLMTVSKNMYRVSLLEENWYIIMDTKKILYDFIRWIFKSESSKIAYPFSKIQQMHYADYRDIFQFDGLDYTNPLLIIYNTEEDLITFYKYFPNYQYLYVNEINAGKTLDSITLRGICMMYSYFDNQILDENLSMNQRTHTITEIFASNVSTDCNFLIKNYSLLDKLDINYIENIEQLKQLRLKYLCIHEYTNTNSIIENLPETIESLIIMSGWGHDISSFNQLNKLPHLTYLKIGLPFSELSTPLNLNTIYLHLSTNQIFDIKIDIPNIRNIIIDRHISRIEKFHLTSEHAITCRLIGFFGFNLVLVLPKCPEVIYHTKNIINFDHNIFGSVRKFMKADNTLIF
jgi:hypothetical protein